MLETITDAIHRKLEEIGFEEDEISAIKIIHELKTGKYHVDIQELINKAVTENIREELLNKVEELSWEMGKRKFISREEIYDT